MSKIVSAVNSMIANADKISDITISEGEEYFFKYDNKYIWGIIQREGGNYSLFYYPEAKDVRSLVGTADWDTVDFLSYKTEDLKSREAYESFRELYLILKEKLYGMDKVFDDIIGGLGV